MRWRNNIYEGRNAWESLVLSGSSMKFGIERYRAHAGKMIAKAEKENDPQACIMPYWVSNVLNMTEKSLRGF